MKKTLLTVSILFACQSFASPWIEANQSDLKHSIDMLVAQGVIARPVNQYPLLWSGIISDLSQIDEANLSEQAIFALAHVRHALSQSKRDKHSSIKALYNGAEELPSGFGERQAQESGINTYGEITTSRVSAKVAVNYADKAQDGKQINHYGSHLAVLFGNWSLSAERLSYWWGPGNESALMLSNHAAPMTAVRLSRANNNYSGPSFLSFIGPWQVTAIAARQSASLSNKTEQDLWGFRAAIFPVSGLEVGFSTTYSDFVYRQETSEHARDKQRLTSLDLKYSSTFFDTLLGAAYFEIAGLNDSGALPHEPQLTVGIESYWGDLTSRVKGFVEYTDTSINCDQDDLKVLCLRAGKLDSLSYTQRDRWLGANIGLNAESITLGANYYQQDGVGGYAKLKYTDFKTLDIQRHQIELGYQQGLFNTLIKVGAKAWRDETQAKSKNYSAVTLSWEMQF
ncbi:capsule assembly Wzi family protein [Pseudoalteromonas sp. T1lg65]|uniref:capsule assembly Wzi family protein n=1 Tax=Pseudoalteromonas sp. T1lg65 TaxID=2077101 RepID=UPI003F7B2693